MSFGIKSSIGDATLRWELDISGDLSLTTKYYLAGKLQNTSLQENSVSKQFVVIGNEVNIIKKIKGISEASRVKGIVSVKSGEVINVSINGALANKVCTFNRNKNEIEFIINNHKVFDDELVIRVDISSEKIAPLMGEHTIEINHEEFIK